MASVVGLDEAKILIEKDSRGKHGMTTLELVIVQSVLLSILILLSILWACCCKKRCVGDQALVNEFTDILRRKLSTSSTRTLPPSYSKVDLTSVGLTLNDHLNPPPTYDRMIAMIESGEITSVPVHLHPEVERRMSLASSYTANNSSRKSSSNSSSSRKSSNSSRKSSRVTFAPNLVQDGIRKQASSQSL